MKKILFITALCCVVVFSYSQADNSVKGYQKGFEFNYSALVGYSGGHHVTDYDHSQLSSYNLLLDYLDYQTTYIESPHSFNLDFVNGYRFNSILFVGGGVGLTATIFSVREKESDSRIHWRWEDEHKEFSMQIPVFARVNVNFTRKKVSPFFSIDIGGNIGIYNDYDGIRENFFGHNLFVKPALGFNIDFKQRQSLYFAFVYDLSYAPKNEGYLSHINHSIGSRIGFNF